MAARDAVGGGHSLHAPLLPLDGRDVPAGAHAVSSPGRSPAGRGGEVEVIVQASEWDAVGSSSDEVDTDPLDAVEDRRERYARMLREQQLAVAKEATSGVGYRTPNFRRSMFYLFSFLENTVNTVALILLFVERKRLTALALVPGQLLVVSMESYQACKDRSIAQKRQALLNRARAASCPCVHTIALLLWKALFDVFVLLVLGCLSFYQLLRARSSWREKESRGFVAEVEAHGNGVEPGVGPHSESPLARYDSHIAFLSGVPRVIFLTTCLLSQYYVDIVVAVFSSAALLSLFNVVRAVVLFDYYASRHIRKQYDTDSPFRFAAAHCTIRFCEILGRMLVLVAYMELAKRLAFKRPGSHELRLTIVLIVNVGDLLICTSMLWWVNTWGPSKKSVKILILSIPIFIVDVSRYIDEHGFALHAQTLSRWLYVLRSLQFLAASLIYYAYTQAPNADGILEGDGATVLLTTMVAAHITCFVLRRGKVGQAGGDVFTAAMDGKVDVLEELLQEGLDPNTRQGDSRQQVVIHVAAVRNHLECVLCLLRHGADPSTLDAQEENALHAACRQGNPRIVQALLDSQKSGELLRSKLLLQRNSQGLRPSQVLGRGAPALLRQLLLAEEKRETETGGRFRSRGLVQNCGSKDLVALFGPMMGGEHYGISRPPVADGGGRISRDGSDKKIPQARSTGSGLTSFMFSRGVGEQLAQVLLDMHEPPDQINLSSLKATGTLGAGGFGKVIKVTDVRTGAFYAMKLQRKDSTTKFAVREAKALHRSDHAFIVRLIRVFQTKTFYGLLMECCELDLNVKILEFSGSGGVAEGLPGAQCARYTACVLLALEYLHHDRRVVFRDLKPENVLVTSSEAGDLAKLTDFGLACSVDKSPAEPDSDGELEGQQEVFESEEAAFLDWPSAGGSSTPAAQPNIDRKHPRNHTYPNDSPVTGTLGFMAQEVFENYGSPESEEARVSRLLARDWYALGCTLLLMLLGEKGNNLVSNGKRKVILPPMEEDIPRVLQEALRERRIDEQASRLAASLTAPLAERAGAAAARGSPFLQDALAELEPLAKRQSEEQTLRAQRATPLLAKWTTMSAQRVA